MQNPGKKAKPVVEPIGGICDSCGKFETDLKRHMEAEHSGPKKCHHCPFEIPDQNKLNLHYLVSPRETTFLLFFHILFIFFQQSHSDLTEKCPHSGCNYSSPVPAHMQHHKNNTHGVDSNPNGEMVQFSFTRM